MACTATTGFFHDRKPRPRRPRKRIPGICRLTELDHGPSDGFGSGGAPKGSTGPAERGGECVSMTDALFPLRGDPLFLWTSSTFRHYQVENILSDVAMFSTVGKSSRAIGSPCCRVVARGGDNLSASSSMAILFASCVSPTHDAAEQTTLSHLSLTIIPSHLRYATVLASVELFGCMPLYNMAAFRE